VGSIRVQQSLPDLSLKPFFVIRGNFVRNSSPETPKFPPSPSGRAVEFDAIAVTILARFPRPEMCPAAGMIDNLNYDHQAHSRTAADRLRQSEGMGKVAEGKPSHVTRNLAEAGKEVFRHGFRHLCRGAGNCPLLRMDRRPEAESQRRGMVAEIHSSQQKEHLVQDQSGKSANTDRKRKDAIHRPRRGGARQTRWSMGAGL
jgi:hypothetical protein